MANDKIKFKRATAARWTFTNPILEAGEPGIEIDTGKEKRGDGITRWVDRPYVQGVGDGSGGASRFVDLTDASNAPIASTNASVIALGNSKVPTTRTIAGKPLSADVTLAKADVGLSAVDNTADMAKPVSTAQAAAIAQVKSDLVNGAGPALDTLNEISAALNNNPSFGAQMVTAVGNAQSDADLAQLAAQDASDDAAAALTAVAGKADLLPSVNLGTGVVTILAATHANRHCYWNGGADATFPVSTSGAAEGDIVEIANGGTATITLSGPSNPTGYKLTIIPGEVGAIEFVLGAWRSLIPAGGSSTALATVTGTGITGSVATCTPASGWSGTFQWTRDGTNLSGATSSTYTLVSGDEGHLIGCKFTPTLYTTNTLTGSAPADTTPPAITAASIPSGDATRIDYVASEALSATLGAANKWTATGGTSGSHTGATITRDDATHFHVTYSGTFAAGETVTYAYTQNSTNDVVDVATTPNKLANITTGAVTNNLVSGSPYLMIRQQDENAAVNLSTDGYDDWYLARKTGDGSAMEKVSASVIPLMTIVGSMARQNFSNTSGGAITVNSGDIQGGGGPVTVSAWPGWQGPAAGKLQFPMPADTTLRRVRVWFGDNCLVRATLSGGGAQERTHLIHYGSAKCVDILYRASSGGQTMTVSLETTDDTYFGFVGLGYAAAATAIAGRADTVTRGDEAPMGTPSDGGSPWFADPSGAAGVDSQLKVQSNGAVKDTGSSSGSWLASNCPNHKVAVKVTELGGGYSWIYAGAYGGNFARARLEYNHYDHTITVQAGFNGSFGNLSSAIAAALGAGNLELWIDGDAITAKLNGSTVWTGSNGGSSAGRLEEQIGLRTDGGGKFSNLVVTPISV